MKYSSGAAFRHALEARILNLHHDTGIPISRYRKLIAFERFLARLWIENPKSWVLKGGFMLELQFQQKARSTKDIDLLLIDTNIDTHQYLLRAGQIDLDDWFGFRVGKLEVEKSDLHETLRFRVTSLLDSRLFENFHVDVNSENILIEEPELIQTSKYLEFAGIEALQIPCYSLSQQIAEKIHALTSIYSSGEVSRIKDLIDILMVIDNCELSASRLRNAITQTFEQRKAQKFPISSPVISSKYAQNYSKLSKEIGLMQQTLEEANKALDEFLSPVISSSSSKTWNPGKWIWE
jgi:hypothetical protein